MIAFILLFDALALNLLKGILERSKKNLDKLPSRSRLSWSRKTSLGIYVISFFFFSPAIFSAAQPTANNAGQAGTNNINIAANPQYTTTINPTFNTTSTINAVGMQVRDITLQIIEKAQKTFTPENYNSAKNLIKELLWNYRYNIAIGITAGAYSTVSILLLTDYNYLTHSTRWSHWKNNYSFEDLCAVSHHELEQELIHAIGEHHVNKKNPTDLSHPLITFIETIEQEIKICKRYLNITKTIKHLHLSMFLPCNDAKIKTVQKYLERALFIRHIFLSWLTERNLTTKTIHKTGWSLTKTTQNRILSLKKDLYEQTHSTHPYNTYSARQCYGY